MNRFIIIFLIGLISSNSFAEEVVYLEQSKPAPFTGFLITEKKAERIRLIDIENKTIKLSNEMLVKENSLVNEQLNIYRNHSDKLAKDLVQERDSGVFGRFGLFLLGAATATLITFGVKQAVR